MKIKPLYLYSTLAVVAVIFLVYVVSQDSSETSMTDQMPKDDIHEQFNDETPPGKQNVSEEFYRQLEVLRKDVEENPKDTVKLKAYADYLTAAHQFESAVPVYNDILAEDPYRTDVYFALTFIYYNKKDFAKAEEVSNKVLLYDKENTQAKFNLGAIAAARGDNENARKIWEKLIRDFPDSREAGIAKSSLTQLK